MIRAEIPLFYPRLLPGVKGRRDYFQMPEVRSTIPTAPPEGRGTVTGMYLPLHQPALLANYHFLHGATTTQDILKGWHQLSPFVSSDGREAQVHHAGNLAQRMPLP